MGEMNTAAISANELVLIMSSIGVLGVIGGWIGEKLNIPDVVIYLILGVLFGPVFLNLVNIDSFPVVNEIILTFGSAFILYEGGRDLRCRSCPFSPEPAVHFLQQMGFLRRSWQL